jgi:hypothetical protein
MGKPIPSVDSQLAAQNQALVKQPLPFSPLKPVIDLAMAMGFIGPPDRYEAAKKVVEATKAENERAAAAAAAVKPGDVMINAGVIEKGADGRTVDNPNAPPPKVDKKAEAKKKADEKKKADAKKKADDQTKK